MSPSAQELESRAERAVRRGELLNALELYEALLAQLPEDDRLRARMESVRSLLQPSELVHRRKAEPVPEVETEPLNDAEMGERHAAEGRFVEAAQAYRRAVAQHPKNELMRERLMDLMKLLPPDGRALDDGLASAEVLEQATPTRGVAVINAHRSAKAADAVFRPEGKAIPSVSAPPKPRAAPLPKDAVEMLRVLLERVKTGRRPRA